MQETQNNTGHRASITRAPGKNKLPICLDRAENSRVHSPCAEVVEEVKEAYLCHVQRGDAEPHTKPERRRNTFHLTEPSLQGGNVHYVFVGPTKKKELEEEKENREHG